MKPDLIQELRELAMWHNTESVNLKTEDSPAWRGADEIERLRSQIKTLEMNLRHPD